MIILGLFPFGTRVGQGLYYTARGEEEGLRPGKARGTYLGDEVLLHHGPQGEGDTVDVTLEGHLHLRLGRLPLSYAPRSRYRDRKSVQIDSEIEEAE